MRGHRLTRRPPEDRLGVKSFAGRRRLQNGICVRTARGACTATSRVSAQIQASAARLRVTDCDGFNSEAPWTPRVYLVFTVPAASSELVFASNRLSLRRATRRTCPATFEGPVERRPRQLCRDTCRRLEWFML